MRGREPERTRTVRVSDGVWEAVKMRAVRERRTVRAVVEAAVGAWVGAEAVEVGRLRGEAGRVEPGGERWGRR